MDNEKFQEFVFEKFDKIDERFDGIDKRFDGIDKRFDGIDKRFDGIDKRLDGLDKRQNNLECDFKVMLKMMEKFGEKQDRLEKIILRMENDSSTKVRALFERSDIHDNRLNDHESRLKTLEGKK